MKYIILKCKEVIKPNVYKYVLIYYLVTFLYFFINYKSFSNNEMSINFCLGLSPIIECNSIESIIKIILISLLFYLTYKIYSFDIIQNIENIYLRCNRKKILAINIFVILAYIIILRLFLLMFINLFIKIDFVIIISDIIYCVFVSITAILLLNLIVKKNFVFLLLFIFIFVIFILLSLIKANNFELMVASLIFLLLTFKIHSPQETINFLK
jgi:hypothetical protein